MLSLIAGWLGADTFNNRVLAFDTALQSEFEIGRPGTRDGEFAYPKGLAVLEGELFVSDTFNRRVQVFTLGGSFVRAFGSEGTELGFFGQPQGLAAAAGYLLVADFTGSCVHAFLPTGHPVQRLELPGRVTDVCVGLIGSDTVYTVDNQHGRIHALALGRPAGNDSVDDKDGVFVKGEL